MLSLLQSSRPYVRLCSDSLNLQLNGFVHLAIGFLFVVFFYQQAGERTQQVQKNTHLTRRFLSYNHPRKTRTVSHTNTQTQSHTEIKACHKETDLPRLTQVQMSQCAWISFGIVPAPSFDKEVFLSPRRDMTVSSGLRSPRQQSGFCRRWHRWTHLADTHTHTYAWREKMKDFQMGHIMNFPVAFKSAQKHADRYVISAWTIDPHTRRQYIVSFPVH